MSKKKKVRGPINGIIPDTNVLIYDAKSLDVLSQNGANDVYLTLTTINEIDNLKDNPYVGSEAREVAHKIEADDIKTVPVFKKIVKMDFDFPNIDNSLGLIDKHKPDHQILATVNYIYKNHKDEYDKIKLVTQDLALRLMARRVLPLADGVIEISDFLNTKTSLNPKEFHINSLDIKSDLIKAADWSMRFKSYEIIDQAFYFDRAEAGEKAQSKEVKENDGFICNSDGFVPKEIQLRKDGGQDKWQPRFVAIRNGDKFRAVKSDIKCLNIHPLSLNGNGVNWAQYIAMDHLLNPAVNLVILEGPAGTGKTLIAVAAAIQQHKYYPKLMITRPNIYLDKDYDLGFTPGDIKDKFMQWAQPIVQNLEYLNENAKDGSEGKKLLDQYKYDENDKEKKSRLEINPLGSIRGQTLPNRFIIVDEAQNMTPKDIRTVISRVGDNTKIVLTGDLSQIDRRFLDMESSGLAFAMKRLRNQPSMGIVRLNQVVRSELAMLADKLLS